MRFPFTRLLAAACWLGAAAFGRSATVGAADAAPRAEAGIWSGPGLDYTSWNGAVLRGSCGTLWGVRVGYIAGGQLVTGAEFTSAVTRAGAYAADGAYADLETAPFKLAWARLADGRMVGRVQARKKVTLWIEAYPALDFRGTANPQSPPSIPYQPRGVQFSVTGDELVGIAPGVITHAGQTKVTGGHASFTNRTLVTRPEGGAVDRFRLSFSRPPAQLFAGRRAEATTAVRLTGAAGYTFRPLDQRAGDEERLAYAAMDLAPGEEIYLVAATSPESGEINWADVKTAFAGIEQTYRRNGLRGAGVLGRGAEPMIGELFWMTTWNPYEQCRFLPAGRAWMADGRFNLWGWDENFNAMIAATVSEPVAERNVLLALGDERVGPLAWWTVYTRYGDAAFLRAGYEFYHRLIPADAALPHGMVGKGMDDTPMRELDRKLGKMRSLDGACMKAWSLEILGRAAAVLGRKDEAQSYRTAHAELQRQIQATFWNPEAGIYRNRYVSGAWPKTESPTSFYPWLAGVPDLAQSTQLLGQLTDPQRFWGPFVLPTLAKDDPEYGKESRPIADGKPYPPFCYWRGAVWPPPNFLVYEGLKRYECDAEAAELAGRSAGLWWKSWSEHGESPENFNPETGERTPMSSTHQSWSMLLPLLGVKELFDIEWWRGDRGALRFGTWSPADNAVENMPWGGHHYDVRCGQGLTELWCDGQMIFRAEGGPVVVREFHREGKAAAFSTHNPRTVRVTLPGVTVAELVIPAGRHRVRVTPDAPAVIEELPPPTPSYE